MTGPRPPSADVLARLAAIVGPRGLVDDATPFCRSFDGAFSGDTPLGLRPGSTEEVAAIMRLCAAERVAIVPQGGNTGLAGGAQPIAGAGQVLLRLDRMKALRALDPVDDTMTVEAGMVIVEAQDHARSIGRTLPLSLASEGTCQIGGVISTNAGGIHVLRYGTMRARVLGLEVVLPDGRIWNGLRALRKDATGYDLKQLFVGAEGTLGIVTAAVLALAPPIRARATAMVAVPDPAAALMLLARARSTLGDSLLAFELMREICLETAIEIVGGARPFAARHGWVVLIEAAATSDRLPLADDVEALLAEGLDAGIVLDAVLADSEARRRHMWALREIQGEAQKRIGEGVKHDVSVPVSAIPTFLARADAAVEAIAPGFRRFVFGHVGDGNLHYNPIAPEGTPVGAFRARRAEINRAVHDIVDDLGGSISAEHGIGRLRVDEIGVYKSPVELDLMTRLRRTLDPAGILNPGKVLPGSAG